MAFIRVPCKTPGDASGKPSKGLPREDALHNTNKGHQGRKGFRKNLAMHPEISKKIGGLPWHAGMENGRTWPRPSLSDLLAELESSNPQRISKKIGGLGSGEDGISPIPSGSGWRMGRHGPWPRPSYRICSRSWRVAIRRGFRKK